MASDVAALVVAGLLVGFVADASAQAAPRPAIFSCEINGKKLRSDRPIAECSNIAIKTHNADGSVAGVIPPTPTAEEAAVNEQRQREADAERAARNDAVRRDRNLVQRYPNEASHQKARVKALDDVRNSVRNSEARVGELQLERKKLEDEKAFYPDLKKLPLKLKLALDANDATMEAQQSLIANQQSEAGRINALFDVELLRLKKLWAGAPLGSLGPAPTANTTTTSTPVLAADPPVRPPVRQ